MPRVSISEAAKLAGIARSNLYKNYIDTGKISTVEDHDGKRKIDTSEILRVFGSIKIDNQKNTFEDTENIQKDSYGQYQNEFKSLLQDLLQEKNARISLLEKELEDSKQREFRLQEQLTINIKLIEQIKPKHDSHKRKWWQFLSKGKDHL